MSDFGNVQRWPQEFSDDFLPDKVLERTGEKEVIDGVNRYNADGAVR